MAGFDMLLGRFYWVSRNPITGERANVAETIAEPQRKNFAPRIGLAYRLGPRTVLRSAYGIFYNSNLAWEWSTGRGNWPYSISDNVTGINIPGVAPTRADQQFGSFDPTKVKPTAQHTIARDLTMPYMQNCNLGVEHQLTQSLLIDLKSDFGGHSPQDNSNIRASLAPSGFDQTHVFNTGYSYQIPYGGLHGPAKLVLGGWQTTGIWTFETGRPFNITLPFDNANVGARGNFQRPNLVGNPFPDGWTKAYGPGGLYFDPRAFAPAPQYTFRNLGRNALRGPGFKNFDVGVFRNFLFTERLRLQYRAEFFNAFNNVNFGTPGTSVGTSNFGRVTGTQNAQRSIQMGLKLYF